MKQFEAAGFTHPETKVEQLSARVTKFLKALDNEVAVEVYGSGIGRSDEDTVTEAQLEAEAEQYFAERRDDFADLLADSSILEDALKLYARYASGEITLEQIQAEMNELLLTSPENAAEIEEARNNAQEEFERAASELPQFLDRMIMANQDDRSVMSRWGNAKLAYENGDDTSSLVQLLEEHRAGVADEGERVKIDRFLYLLKQ